MPVLPLVGSSTVQPGVSRPSFSACSTMKNAGLSLIDPVGFRSSSLAQSRTVSDGDRRGRPTSGVRPSASSNESYRAIGGPLAGASGDRRQDRHDVAVDHRGLYAAEEPDILVVEVDVDEAVERAVRADEAV